MISQLACEKSYKHAAAQLPTWKDYRLTIKIIVDLAAIVGR